MSTVFNKINDLIELQHGAIARYQLVENNVSNSSVDTLLRNATFKRASRGVFVACGTRWDWKLRASVAVLSCGKYSMLSYESALVNSGLLNTQELKGYRRRRSYDQRNSIHVLCKRSRRHEKDVYYHRSTRVDDFNTAIVVDGIRQVPVERAIIDSAQQLTESELDFTISRAFSQNLSSPQKLLVALNELPSAPGREKKRTREFVLPYLANENSDSTESFLEKRVERILRSITTDYISQFKITLGGNNYRLDFAIKQDKVAIEVDGFAFHSHRQTFDSDRIRQNLIVADGWNVVRITASFTDDEIFDTISSVLGHKICNSG